MIRLALGWCFASSVACAAPSSLPVESPSSAELPDGVVVFEYVGEVDAAAGTWSIRPALAHERSTLAAKSWSRISTTGTSAPTINIATGALTTGAGTTSPGTFANPSPSTYPCVAGHQCGYVSISQGTTNVTAFSNAVAVLYNVSNGVTFDNGEALPSDSVYGTSVYQNALPTASASYLRYGGMSGTTNNWSTFAWASGSSYARPWDWNLHGAAGFTFTIQLWGVVNRTGYPLNFTQDGTATFTDACATGTDVTASLSNKVSGFVTVPLDFSFSIFANTASSTVKTAQAFDFWLDGALTARVDGASSSAAVTGTGAPNDFLGTVPAFSILPYWANFNLTSGGKLCYLKAGTKPSRVITFTWKDVPYAQDTAKKATFSTVLHENTDQIDFQFSSLNAPGNSITSGIRGDNGSPILETRCTQSGGFFGLCQLDVHSSLLSSTSYKLKPTTPAYVGP